MVTRFSVEDPIHRGGFYPYDGWMFWVWEFQSGWKEWVPASVWLGTFCGMTPGSQEAMLDRLHYLNDLSPIPIHYWYRFEQMEYWERSQSKSDWYYNTIPENSSWVAICVKQ